MNENEGDARRERKQEERERISEIAHWLGAPQSLGECGDVVVEQSEVIIGSG
jgi:hypothetical protein